MFLERNRACYFGSFSQSGLCQESMDYIVSTMLDWEADEFEVALFYGENEESAPGYARQKLEHRTQWMSGGKAVYTAGDVYFGYGSFGADRAIIFHVVDGKRVPIMRFIWPYQFTRNGEFTIQWSDRGIFRQERGANLLFFMPDDKASAGVRVVE